MLHPSTKRLIDKLEEMTRKERVAWTESDDGSVTHDTEGYRVLITAPPHEVRLSDARGREIEVCTPDEFAGEFDGADRPYADFVADLYREALRHARGAEKAISALLESLDAADAEPAVPPAPAEVPETAAVVAHEAAGELPEPEEAEPEVPATAAIDGQDEMQQAVADMADRMTAPEPLEEVPAPVHQAEVSAPQFEEPAFEPEPPDAEFVLEAEPEDTLPEAYAEDLLSEDAAEDWTPETEPAAEPEPEPEAEPESVWSAPLISAARPEAPEERMPEPAVEKVEETIDAVFEAEAPADPEAHEPPADDYMPFGSGESAPEQDTTAPAAEREIMEVGTPDQPEPAPEPEPAPAPPPRPPVFGSGIFGGSMGDVSRYRTDAPAAEPESPAAQPEPPAPATEPARPAAPSLTQPISLSGITSGFGLGATAPQRMAPTPAPAPATPPAPEHRVIDGTADLPDEFALPEQDEAPADFSFEPAPHEASAFAEDTTIPEPAAAQVEEMPPPRAMPDNQPEEAVQAPDESDPEPSPSRPVRRFNPWN
ncbi:MAG: hypothetical protein R3C13_11000 [Hyphomonas sp.]|uniref:hypothetical protein n=1 Tax=Hyphomonas sp. TaxID=87 RepID=UPI0035287DF2